MKKTAKKALRTLASMLSVALPVTVLATVLVTGTGTTPAQADGGNVGSDLQVAQSLGERDLTVIVRRAAAPPAPLRVDVVTHAGSPAGVLDLAVTIAGETPSTARVELGPEPGVYGGTLRVDRAGPWELSIDDGEQVATIPFVVPAVVAPPWEDAVYGGFIAAGALLLAALVLALAGRPGAALVPAGGMVAALAVGVTGALLAPTIPLPPAVGTHLDPTAENVADPYAPVRVTDFSRPPVNVVPGIDGDDLVLHVTDGSTGRPVDDLLVHDSAFIHLVLVSPSGDLRHVHPVRVAPGEYRVSYDDAEAGVHAVAAELARRGGGVQLARGSVTVEGDGPDTEAPVRHRGDGRTGPAAGLAQDVAAAGEPSTFTADFGTATLQPWLGMVGHMIVVGPLGDGPAGTNPAVAAPVWAHVHAMVPPTPGFPVMPDESVAAYGPEVRFTYTFPQPGRYRVWVQAEQDYSVLTVPAVVDVPATNGAQR
ncbi:hypothetical protein [Promicromonospora sp. NPDC050880]|uniref:hypothetical protein n=1 Tax=Promicromonospora sp. NPDC050880 TaxID=3364406 RepID=UPI003794BDBC